MRYRADRVSSGCQEYREKGVEEILSQRQSIPLISFWRSYMTTARLTNRPLRDMRQQLRGEEEDRSSVIGEKRRA